MSLITVAQATTIVLSHARDFGLEDVVFNSALGRVLATDIIADRDLPPYNRVTMDGIAIRYAAFGKGIRSFRVAATMAAGDSPAGIEKEDECVELMTGCALPDSTDTVIRYEDVSIENGIATVDAAVVKQGANIHRRGEDKRQGAIVVAAYTIVDATIVSMAASVGQHSLTVKKLPRVVIISTGDELVDVHDMPTPYQVRRSNSYAIQSVLKEYNINADALHISDEPAITKRRIQECLSRYDVIILSGGVSAGKFDFVPNALEELGVTKLFHKVRQRPGKPFWFGSQDVHNTVVFAFPGNPVSAFLCLYRYFIPWLRHSLGMASPARHVAMLSEDFTFSPEMQMFVQVSISINELGQLVATPIAGNGSGDFSNLLQANAFMELPAEISNFKKGEIYPIWPFKQII